MTKPREKTREELQAEIEDGKKKIRQLENREKVLRQKLSQEERRTRSHRLIVRGAVLSEKTHRGRETRIIPLEQRGRNYTPPRGWCIAFSEGSLQEGCDFPQPRSAPNQTGDATLPLRWLPPATLLWTCHLGTPCVASCSQPISFIKYNANGKLT